MVNNTPVPFEWPPFLQRVSRELLMDEAIRGMVPPDAVSSEWLGYPGASEDKIVALEKRLGVRLPVGRFWPHQTAGPVAP
jgi:hypothetical protein